MKAFHRAGLIALALASTLAAAPADAAKKEVRIGIVLDGPWGDNDSVRKEYETAISKLLEDEYDVKFPASKLKTGDWSMGSIRPLLESLLNDKEVDIVITLGVIGSHVAGRLEAHPKPVIAPFVIDPTLQDIPLKDGKSGTKNFTYVSFPSVLGDDLRAFKELVDFEKCAILTTAGYAEAIDGLTDKTRSAGKDLGVELVVIPVAESAQAALDAIPKDVDAVYLAAVVRLSSGEVEKLAKGFIERKLPSFSLSGMRHIEKGILSGIAVGIDEPRIRRRIALNVQRVLLGEDAGGLTVVMSRNERLAINMSTARAIDFSPTWAALTDAELVSSGRKEVARTLTLADAAKESIIANLDLAANEREVLAGEETVKIARANLLPTVNLSANGVMIDSDRAVASFGQTAQIQGTAQAELQQVLFSDRIYANLTIQKHLQNSRTYQRRALELDVTLEATTAFLNLLRARAFENIRRDNLGLTRSNLQLAQVRRSIGVAGPSEVYRWESELAQAQSNVIAASAQRNVAEMEVNRVLNRPLEEPFRTKDVGLDSPAIPTGGNKTPPFLSTPSSFKVFRQFLVREGLEASPELRAVDEAIGARTRGVTASWRNFYLPQFFLTGNLSHIFARAGDGAERMPVMIPGVGALPQADDTNWSVAAVASIPLFVGGGRFAELERAELELTQTELERKALAQRIEQRIRTATHFLGASFANIRLAQASAEAAAKNLKVVQDAYGRGAISYLNLLDAQNAALVSRLVAANAVYDCLIDFMNVQRAVSRFNVLETDEDNRAFIEKLVTFVEQERKGL